MRGALWALMVLLTIGLAEAQPGTGSSKKGSRKAQRAEAASETANVSADPEEESGVESADNASTHTQAGADQMAQAVVVQPTEKTAQQLDMNTTMPLALNNVPLDQLVRFLADTTGKTVIKQRDINTQVSINAPKPVTKREALELIYSALQTENIYVAEQDNVLQIVNQNSIKNIKLESIAADTDVQTLADSLRIVQKIYKFKNISADEVRTQLQMFMTQTAMTVEPRSNSLLMTDQLTRIKAFDKVVQALDGLKSDKVIVTYKLTNTNPNDLVMLLQRMISNGALEATEEGQTTASLPVSVISGAVVKTNTGFGKGGSNDITLIPDARFNWVIALCPRAQKAGLDRLVNEFDITKSDDHVVQIYKLKNTDAAQMMSLLNQIISNKGLGASPASGSGAAAMPPAGGDGKTHGPKYWKRMADSMGSGGGGATQAGDIVLMPEMRQNWIIAIMRPDLKAQLDELVKTFDVERELTIKPRTMDLKGGSAVAMAATITRLVGSLPVTSARDYISVIPTDDGTHLLVFSSEANFKIVEDLIKTVGTVSNDRVMEIFKIKNTESYLLVGLINNIISSKGLAKSASSGSAAPSGASDGQRHGPGYYRRMAASMGSATLGGAAQGGDLLLIPESRLNWIIAIMRPDLKDEVKALIDEFDVEKTREVQARTIDIPGGGATALAGTLTGLLSDQPVSSTRDYIRITAQTNNRLIVMSTESNFQVVQDLIKTVGTVPNNRTVQIYKIVNTDAAQLMSMINTIVTTKGLGTTGSGAGLTPPPSGGMSRGYFRRMMESMSSSGSGGSGTDLLMMPDTRQNWIIAIMKPELKPEVEAIIKQFDVAAVKDVSARTIDLKGGNATQMATTLNGLLSSQVNMGGPRDYIQVTAAPDNKRLIVMSSEANFKTVQDLLETIGDKPNDRTIEIFKVKNADCSQLITLFNQVIQTKGIGTTASAGAVGGGYSASSGMSYRGYMRRMMEASASAGGGGTVADIMFIPDADKNWIIAIMKPSLKPEIEALLKQFDVPSVKDVTARTIAVTTGTATITAATLSSLLMDQQGSGSPRDMIRVTAAPDNARLIVTSTEGNFQVVQDLLKTIGSISNNRVFEIYHIKNMDSGALLTLITPIITSKGLGTIGSSTPVAAYSPSSGYSYRGYMRRMAETATAAAGGGGANDMQFIPEAQHNWLIAIMKPSLKPEIDKVIKEFDIPSTKDLTARTIDVTTGSATITAATLTSLLSDQMASAGPRDIIRVTAAPDNARLIVTSTEANFQVVQDLLKTVGNISNNKIFEIYKIKYLDAGQMLTLITPIITSKGLGTIGSSTPMQAYSPSSGYSYRGYMRRMADAATQAAGGSGNNDMQFIPETGHNWLIAIMKPSLKAEIDKLIQQFDVEVAKDISPRTIELKSGNAGAMAGTLTGLLADQSATGNPRDYVKVTAAPDNTRLIVMSSEANFKVVQDLVTMVGDAPANRVVEIYKIKFLDASQLVSLLTPIITSKGLGSIGSSAAMPSFPSSSSSGGGGGFRSFMRRMADAQAASGGGSTADIQFIPEAAHNWLITIMKPTVKTEIEALIKQFDVETSKDITARTVALKGGNASGMAATLTALLVDQMATGNPRDYIKVTAAPDNLRLIVMSSEANFKMVQDLVTTVGDLPNDRLVETYKIKNMDVSALLSILTPIITNKGLGTISTAAAAAPAPTLPASSSSSGSGMGMRSYLRQMASQAAASGGQLADITFIPDADHNALIAIMKPGVKKDVEALIKQFDVETSKDLTARTLDLKGGNATAMAATLNSLLTDQNAAGNPRNVIRITPATDNTRLIVMSSEANFQVVQNLVQTIGITPNNRVVNIYKIVNTDANQLMSIINTIITNKGLGTTGSGTAAASPALPAPSTGGGGGGFRSFFARLATATSAGGAGGPASDLMMMVDPRLNWIIAVMKPDLQTEVEGIIKQFDIETSKDVTARIIEARTLAASQLAVAISGLLPAQTLTSSPRDFIKVTASDDTRMVVMSSEANYKLVQELAKTLDDIPDDRVVEIYKLTSADASELTMLLNNVLSKAPMMKGATGGTSPAGTARVSPVGASGASAGGATSALGGGASSGALGAGGSSAGGALAGGSSGSSSGSSRYSRILGGSSVSGGALGSGISRRLGASGASVTGSSASSVSGYSGGLAASANAVTIGAVTLIPELRLNWIIAIFPKDLKTEIDAMVKQFDIEKPKDLQPRIVEVKHVDATTLATTLNTLLLQQSATGRREAVRVAATDDGNRLLIWSTETNFKDVEQMIKSLDVETTKDVQARLIDVRFAEATNLATTLNNLFNNQYWTSKKEYVRVSATDDGNRLMVMSSEANYKVIEDMIKKLDTQDGENMVTQVYKIEHLEAQALSDQLTTLFQARSRAGQGSAASMFFGGYGYGSSSNQRQSIQQPSIVPSPRTNTIMVMARPKDIPFINDMVKELDVPIDPSSFEPRIYRIHNTDASEVMTVLQDLFQGKTSAAGSRSSTTNVNYYLDSWRPNSGSNQGDAITQVFGQLRFVVDRMTNTIVALSSNPKNYEILDSVIQKLDSPDPENSEVMVYDLKYADALKVANQMNYLFSQGQTQRAPSTPQPQPNRSTISTGNGNNNNIDPQDQVNSLDQEVVQDFVPLWGSSPTASRPGQEERPINTMIGKVRVVPDIRSNKLMVAAPPVYFPTLGKLVETLDKNEPQVYITTRILEITRGKEKRIGMRWTPDPTSIDPGELDNAFLALNQLGFLDSFGHADKLDPSQVASDKMIATKNFGTFDGSSLTMAPTLKNGNSIISSQVNIALLMQLLVKNTESRIYSEPGVTVNNNETGNIFFGSEYPFRVNQTTNLNGNNQTVGIQYRPVGINLDIRPHINSDDEVVLKTAVENSNVRAELIDGQLIKDMRRFTTDVSLRSGETMVIGGILIDDGQKVKHGVPILGDLPLLKYVFGKNDTIHNIRELVFFVTPTVISTSQDSRKILTETQDKINSIEGLTSKQMDKEQAFAEFPELRGGPSPRPLEKGASSQAPVNAKNRRVIHAELPEVDDEASAGKLRPEVIKDGTATIIKDDAPVIREEKPVIKAEKPALRMGDGPRPGSPVTIRNRRLTKDEAKAAE